MMRSALTVCAAAAVVVATAAAAPAQAAAHSALVVTVAPGSSIQAAVDAAQPGETIQLLPGVYHESVLIQTDDITIQGAGAGPGGTELLPPAVYPDNPCGTSPPEEPPHGGGICFRGGVSGTVGPTSHATWFLHGGRVTGIRFDGFAVGVAVSADDGIRVDHNVVLNAGHYGITNVLSKNGVMDDNQIVDAHDSGFYIGDYNVPLANTTVVHNQVQNGQYGISEYDSQGVLVAQNDVSGNCVGDFDMSDSLRVPGGDDLAVVGNSFTANNNVCAGVPEINFPELQGTGVLLIGSVNVAVTGNVIQHNTGAQPLSGGVVVGSSQPYDPNETVTEGSVTVSGNVVTGNGPYDLYWDGAGSGVNLSGNVCGTSSPGGQCGS